MALLSITGYQRAGIETVLGSNNPLGVVLAALVGIPMYADIFGTIPVAEALLAKGSAVRYNFGIYDGGNNIKPAINNYAEESRKA